MSELQIPIKISQTMVNNFNTQLNENFLIRIPEKIRIKFNIDLGKSMLFRTNECKTLQLFINKAYKEDSLINEDVCYITEYVYGLLKNNKIITTDNKITLGCDPEFFLVEKNTKNIVYAYNLLNKWGDVGHDGVVAELRPAPSLLPSEVTNNLYELIKKLRTILNNNEQYDTSNILFYSKSSYGELYAGYHLHYGIPNHILYSNKQEPIATIVRHMALVMDYYIGIPSIIIEGESDCYRRTDSSSSYGKPSDVRVEQTLEYRVPGGCFLKHPVLTEGLISLGSVVMEDMIDKLILMTDNFTKVSSISLITKLNLMYHNILDINSLYKIMCNRSTKQATKYIDSIYDDVSNMKTFNANKLSINKLFNIIFDNVKYNDDIEANWCSHFDNNQTDIQIPCNYIS